MDGHAVRCVINSQNILRESDHERTTYGGAPASVRSQSVCLRVRVFVHHKVSGTSRCMYFGGREDCVGVVGLRVGYH